MIDVVIVDAYPATVGGAHRVAAEIAVAGAATGGWRVTVLLPAEGPAARWLRREGVDVEVLGDCALPRQWWRLARRLRRTQVIHIHDLRGLLLAGPAALLLRRRPVWHVHSASKARFLHRLAAVLLLAAGVTVVVPSRRGARVWAGSAAPRLTELPNTCAPAAVAPEGRTPLVVTVARRHPDKGLVMLLEAFTEVRRTIPDAALRVIAPPEPGYPEYDARLTELAQGPGIDLTGVVEDVATARAGAWVYCQPSLFEPFGLAALEASAAGLPVVACDVGGLPDVVVDGETGLLVAPTSTRLATALTGLLVAPDRRAALGSAGRARVAASFSRAAFAERLRSIYGLAEP